MNVNIAAGLVQGASGVSEYAQNLQERNATRYECRARTCKPCHVNFHKERPERPPLHFELIDCLFARPSARPLCGQESHDY